MRVHGDQLVQLEHVLGRIAAGQPGKVDLQIAVGLFLGHQRRKHRVLALVIIGQLAAFSDVE